MRFVPLDPFPVEITNHADWWQPWLPVGTGLVIAMVAFAGVLISNRTNRLAIAAADGREVDKWKRDTLLRLCSEAVTASLEVESLYEKGVKERENIDKTAILAAIQKIGPVAETINLIGDNGLTELARRLEEACNGIESFADCFILAKIAYDDRVDDLKKVNASASPEELRAATDQALKELFITPESDFAESIRRMAMVRQFFINRSRDVLNQTTLPARRRRWYRLWLC